MTVFQILARLVGPIGSGDRFGQALAIDDIRCSEVVWLVPLDERLPLQPREVEEMER